MSNAQGIERLIYLCNNGDFSAWSQFIEQFSPIVSSTIKHKISNSTLLSDEDARDIYQQIFLSIWQKKKLKNIRFPGAIYKWLIMVVQNATLDYIKAKRKEAMGHKGAVEPLATSSNPREEAQRNMLDEEIENFLSLLPIREKRILTLDIVYDLKHKKIAEIMNMPIATAATIIRRSKEKLKDYLLKKGYNI